MVGGLEWVWGRESVVGEGWGDGVAGVGAGWVGGCECVLEKCWEGGAVIGVGGPL